jgi:tRNA (cytidine/uridine-2'-O-)-methyltransferase
MRLALFQPDIAANAGTLIRLGACMDVAVDIIEPCGFPFGDAAFRRAGMDYVHKAIVTRHASWKAFRNGTQGRLILASTKSSTPYTAFAFEDGDTLLLGRESAGVPTDVAGACTASVCIPMTPGTRSLNVAVAGAMILGEMIRQTRPAPATAREQAHEH